MRARNNELTKTTSNGRPVCGSGPTRPGPLPTIIFGTGGEMRKIVKSVEEAINTKIEPEEIIYLVKEMTRLRDEGHEPNWYTSIGILAERYRNERGKPFCITERMECLAEMMKDPRMRGWSLDGPQEGCMITSEAVFTATAKCTLQANEKQFWFDADEFFNIALMSTPSEGSA